MNQGDATATLNRLLHVLCCSLPMYLKDAQPWDLHDHDQVREILANLVADQQLFAGRVAETILDLGGRPDRGRFPTRFTDIHDLDLDFLLRLIIDYQRQDIATLESCVAHLSTDPWLRSLAEEVLGNAKGHLEILQQLPSRKAAESV